MGRHPHVTLRQAEATSLLRATTFNKKAIDEFFENLENLIDRYKLTAGRIYNMDETSLTTVQKPHKVLTTRGKKQVGAATSAERGTNTTGVFCTSATGQYVAPMLIFKRKRLNTNLEEGALP